MKEKHMNSSLSKCICIGLILSCALTEQLFAAATPEECIPTDLEQHIVEAALTTKPYSPLTQWLMQLYQSFDYSPVVTFSAHKEGIFSVAISHDGSKLVTGSWDGTAKIWNMSDGSLIATLAGHTGAILSVAISSDGSKIVTGSDDKTAKIWNMSDGSLITTLSGHGGEIIAVAISPDGSKIVTTGYGPAKLWDMFDGSLIATLHHPYAWVTSVAISPDGSKIVTGSREDLTAKVWNMFDHSLITSLSGHNKPIASVAISGSKIVTGSYDTTAKVWNMFDGSLIATLPDNPDLIWGSSVISVAINVDGSKIATAGYGSKIWSMPDSLFVTLDDHKVLIRSVAISPDGSKVVTGSSDRTAKIWNMPQDLFETLKKLTLKQISFLAWLHGLIINEKKADFTKLTFENAPYINQYLQLPPLIKDMVKRFVKFK